MEGNQEEESLYNQMKECLSTPTPRFEDVKELAGKYIEQRKAFPADLRFRIWEVLLDVCESVQIVDNSLQIDRTRVY